MTQGKQTKPDGSPIFRWFCLLENDQRVTTWAASAQEAIRKVETKRGLEVVRIEPAPEPEGWGR